MFIVILYTTIVPSYNDLKTLNNIESFKPSEVVIDSIKRFGGESETGFIGYSKKLASKTIYISYSRFNGIDVAYQIWSSDCCRKAFLSNENNEFPLKKIYRSLLINIIVILIILFFSSLLIQSIHEKYFNNGK